MSTNPIPSDNIAIRIFGNLLAIFGGKLTEPQVENETVADALEGKKLDQTLIEALKPGKATFFNAKV